LGEKCLSFVSKLHCATGICPRDLEDYGCSCRYVAAGNPVDALDVCCEAHRLCYQHAAPCRQELPLAPYNFSCAAAANTSCGETYSLFWEMCLFCECDRAAIDCMTQSPYNSSLRGLADTSCRVDNQSDTEAMEYNLSTPAPLMPAGMTSNWPSSRRFNSAPSACYPNTSHLSRRLYL
uniref:Phospholipase A2 n=1 Tax=Neolamprologus brichardi TaxID=32507 RepID=A0A3Q4MX78_NEOBR